MYGDYEAAGGKAKSGRKKRPLSAYNKFVKKCSKTPEGLTRSGKDMMTYCASQWRKLSDAEKQKYK